VNGEKEKTFVGLCTGQQLSSYSADLVYSKFCGRMQLFSRETYIIEEGRGRWVAKFRMMGG
jgi:hypothetical protein